MGVPEFILCMFEMELANQIMGSGWEYVGKRRVTWHWIKQIFDLIKFVIRVTARVGDGNLRTEETHGDRLFVDRDSICVRAATTEREYDLYGV